MIFQICEQETQFCEVQCDSTGGATSFYRLRHREPFSNEPYFDDETLFPLNTIAEMDWFEEMLGEKKFNDQMVIQIPFNRS